MGSGTTVQRRQAKRQKPPKIRNRQTAIDHAVRVIYRVCCLAGSANLIDDIRADLDADGVRAAIKNRDTAAVFDWLIAALSYQGISDRIAYEYMEQHGYVQWNDINRETCPRRHVPQAQKLLALPRLPLRQAPADLHRAGSHRRLSAANPSLAQRPPEPARLFALSCSFETLPMGI